MEKIKQYFTSNILPGFAAMIIGVTGAYFVYNTYYSNNDDPALQVSYIEPAAGDQMEIQKEVIKPDDDRYISIDVNNIEHYSSE